MMSTQDHEVETADLVRRTDLQREVAEAPAEEHASAGEGARSGTEGWRDEAGDNDGDGGAQLLFADGERQSFEQQWTEVQSRFVDDPRDAVSSADHLVAQVMQTLAGRFADHRSSLEQQWGSGGEADTEQLRQAMQRYRTFLHRLLAA